MLEVEIRARIKKPSEIQTKLLELGFVAEAPLRQLDLILDTPDANLFRSGRKLRIRVENSFAELTYKGMFLGDQDVSRREELDIPISAEAVEQYLRVFEALGFPLCARIPKTRHKFTKDKLTVSFDEWPIIGCLVEIEGEETQSRNLAHVLSPSTKFSNYRLSDLFAELEAESGMDFGQLKETYEKTTGFKLGRLDLLIGR